MYQRDLYWRAFRRATAQALNGDEDAFDRAVFYGVRLLGRERKDGLLGDVEDFELGQALLAMIELLEPRRFVRLFPVEKTYRGAKHGFKDYFFTIQMIEEHGWDRPIGNAMEFLWDYENPDVRNFLVSHLSRIRAIRQSQGQPGILEEWARENGIRTFRLYTDERGKQFLMDDNGRTYPVKKARPRHLKAVEGKRPH
ncbi:MAG: hypothetical protein K6U74_04710 [Firmicutes bacterium]|nr:hypothetical protein [Bacillota bacterium]